MEEKEARIQRALRVKKEIIDRKINPKREEEERSRGTTSIFVDFKRLLAQEDFNFLASLENQLLELDVENKLPENPLDKEVSILVSADNRYAIQIRQYKDVSVGPNGVKEVIAGAVARDNMRPVIITTHDFTEAAIELAKENKVELIDGQDVEEWQNPAYRRKFEQQESGFYEYLQRKLISQYGFNNVVKTNIIICMEEFRESEGIMLEEYKQDYLEIAEILLPEYKIELEFVPNEEKLPIFPLVKAGLEKDKKREVSAILRRPVLATLYEECIYSKNIRRANALKRRNRYFSQEDLFVTDDIGKY